MDFAYEKLAAEDLFNGLRKNEETAYKKLLEGLKERNRAALLAFWQFYLVKVQYMCAKVLDSTYRDPKDVAGDVMMRFLDDVIKLKDHRALWSYLKISTVRYCQRTEKKWKKFVPVEDAAEIEDKTDAVMSMTQETKVEYYLLVDRLRQCIRKLTSKAQNCLKLKYQEDWTQEEIGNDLKISKQRVGQIIKKSHVNLRECLENQAISERMRASTAESGHVLSLNKVEQLLVDCYRYPTEDHADHLLGMASIVAGLADEGTKTAFDNHLASCPVCTEVMRRLLQIDSDQHIRYHTTKSSQKPNLKGVPIVLLAAAAVLVFGLAVYFTLAPSHEEKAFPLRIKGFEDRISVVVQRGTKQFVLAPLDKLQKGDRLAITYSANRAGFLLIVSRDTEGRATLLYPTTGTESAPISADENIPLKEGGFVEQGTGCEWVIAVFSDEPLDVGRVLRAVEESRKNSKECGIETTIPGARSVRITPVLR